ncbi:MAG: hypothetical protein KDA25_08545, partial [Phycisphaerales bacterium]|nr:hypothetical protein [Phycisphaerales bacterium]
MTDEHEPSEAEGRSDELSDRVDDALSRLWRGDAAPIDELLSALDGAGPSVGGIVAGLGRSAGLPDSPSGGTIGPYEIVRELGRGAMGTVFEARRHAPDRTVALKLLRGGPFIDDYHV